MDSLRILTFLNTADPLADGRIYFTMDRFVHPLQRFDSYGNAGLPQVQVEPTSNATLSRKLWEKSIGGLKALSAVTRCLMDATLKQYGLRDLSREQQLRRPFRALRANCPLLSVSKKKSIPCILQQKTDDGQLYRMWQTTFPSLFGKKGRNEQEHFTGMFTITISDITTS